MRRGALRAHHEAGRKEMVSTCAAEEVARWLERADPPRSKRAAPFKSCSHGWRSAGGGVRPNGRAREEAGRKGVGDQALIRGLAAAVPTMRPRHSLSCCGRRLNRPQSVGQEFLCRAPPLPLRVNVQPLWWGRRLRRLHLL